MSEKLKIGGQAVIEGVMMRTAHGYSVAVRRPNDEIALKVEQTAPVSAKKKGWRQWPFFRGSVNLVDSLYLGIKCLLYASNEALGEEEELSDGMMWLSVFMGIGGAILLFMVLPTLLTGFAKQLFTNSLALNLIEGFMRIGIFIAYVLLITRMPDIKRVFQYHGAEHKTINCYEAGCDLSVAETQKFTTLHVRCGTAFMLLVMIIAVFVFTLFGWQPIWMRILTRIVLLPLIAGISYEIIQAAGKNQNKLIWRIALAPGLLMQNLTTYEPDDQQVEVAIAAFKAALDQEIAYQNNHAGVKTNA